MDVITTSGMATGSAPAVEKIRSMREAIGKHPLAIASGMTPENVSQFMPYADAFLVATGISKSSYELDPAKVAAFVKAIS
jgi:predicted TIM-barrel enzyme